MAISQSDMRQVLKLFFLHRIAKGSHVPACFWGPSGVGKTAGVGQAAEELSLQLGLKVRAVIFKPGQADSAGDLVGFPEKVTFYPCPWCLAADQPSDEYTERGLTAHVIGEHEKDWAETAEAMRRLGDRVVTKQRYAITDVWPTCDYVLVCIDEVNRASPDIRNALLGLVNERVFELSGYRLPDKAIVFCTANPTTSEYADTHELDGAMIKRMVHFHVLPSAEEWLDYMATQPEGKTPAGAKAIAYFRENPQFITPTELENPVLEQLSQSNRLSTALVRLSDILTGRLLGEAAAGTIGAKAAQSFMAHMSRPETWVRAKDILADYTLVRPQVLSARHAGRSDMFLQTQDDLLRTFATRDKTLKDAEVKNVVAYLKDLLADQLWSILAALTKQHQESTTKGKPTDPINRHLAALFKAPDVKQLVAEHRQRVQNVLSNQGTAPAIQPAIPALVATV